MKHLPKSWRAVAGGFESGPADQPIRVVLLPGIRGDPSEFISLAPQIGGRIFIARYPDQVEPRLPAYAERVLETLILEEPVHVVGASFGGLVGWAFPAAKIRRLTTIGSLPEKTATARKSGMLARIIPRIPELLYRTMYSVRNREGLQVPSQDGLARRLTAISRWDLPASPPAPVVCMWGKDDEFVTWSEDSVRSLGFQACVLPGGHFPHLTHPEAVINALSLSDPLP